MLESPKDSVLQEDLEYIEVVNAIEENKVLG